MKYQWILEKQADNIELYNFAKKFNNLPLPIVNILLKKGIKSREEAIKFFKPDLKNLHDPFLMKDMDKAVNRLHKAINHSEKILIYGDYDTDGTTAVALMYLFLKNLTKNIEYYIPDRNKEGYGISTEGINYAIKNNFNLIIALDCGIKAIDKVKYAKENNIDVIICDHHTPDDTIPEAIAVLDPKRKDCQYPFKELTGCGIGFKLIQAYALKNNIDKQKVFEHLDLVAISTAADIVPIIDENRILVAQGLKQLKNTKKNGLKALINIAGLKNKDITVADCVFKLSPRINAAGRLEHAKKSVELLISDNEKSELFSKNLDNLNQNRQNYDRQITNQIFKIFEQNPKLKQKYSTVIYNENWHKGVIGIVASKVIERYYKPTIILTKSENKLTGSGRSIENFNLYNAISDCKEYLERFGGHKYAAGLTLDEKNLTKFTECFEQSVKQKITPDQKSPKIYISDIIEFSQINNRFIQALKFLAPFGPGNLNPIFLTTNVIDNGGSQLIGKNQQKDKHIKLDLTDPTGYVVPGIAFNMAEYFPYIKNKNFDICYSIDIQQDNKFILNIKDIKIRY